MNLRINKTKSNGVRTKEEIPATRTEFGAGYGADFWWKLHFHGKDKNGRTVVIDVEMDEKEREKFIADFEEYTKKWKEHIKNNK